MTNLLRTLDSYVFSLQSAQLTRVRNYNDQFVIRVRHPRNAPDWTYIDQDIPPDTEFSAPQTEEEGGGGEEGNEFE